MGECHGLGVMKFSPEIAPEVKCIKSNKQSNLRHFGQENQI